MFSTKQKYSYELSHCKGQLSNKPYWLEINKGWFRNCLLLLFSKHRENMDSY